jgi:hypothetical protein
MNRSLAHVKVLLAIGVAASAIASASTAAAAASSADGVFFVHGTGDYTPPSNNTLFAPSPTDGTAMYFWTPTSLASMTAAPQGGSWSYGVAGYSGLSQNAQTSWGTVGDQLFGYYMTGNYGQIWKVTVVTNSNGSNPIRYLLAHPTAVTPLGHTASSIMAFMPKVVFIAGDNAGTPLADKITQNTITTTMAADALNALFGSNYNWKSPGIVQQVQANMTTYNANGTFATGSTPGGISTNYIYGSGVNANYFSSEASCGGYKYSAGLKALQLYGWGSWSAQTDGFLGVNSSTLVGTDPNEYGGDPKLNHNQSRLSCDGVNSKIAAYIHSGVGNGQTAAGTFTAPPPDYTEPPAVQACDVATPGNLPGYPSGTFYQYGCTSAMHADANTDLDCLAIYGADNYSSATQNYTVSIPTDYALTGYSNPSYYATNGAGCSDTWLGDGECDLCLLAKYGYDSAPGTTGDDDCVNQGSGTKTYCADLLYNYATSTIGYYSTTVTH